MVDLDEFRRVSDRLRNWGRWGADDQIGTLNFITPECLVAAAGCVRQGKVFSLGADFTADGVQGHAAPFRGNPLHFMTVDGGDANSLPDAVKGWRHSPAEAVAGIYGASILRFNDDYIVMPLQAATQWDALSHVYYDELLYNDVPAASVTSFGATRNSIAEVGARGGITARGVLLDAARHRGAEWIDGGDPISPDELDAIAAAQGVDVRSGDVVVVRTGWYTRFVATGEREFQGNGLGWQCAEWLHEHEVAAVAADNLAVEAVHVMDVEGVVLPLHLLCQRDMGLMFGEVWNLDALADDCAADGTYVFQLAAPALRVTGGVGSPLNPLALK